MRKLSALALVLGSIGAALAGTVWAQGTLQSPKYYAGPTYGQGDVHMQQRFFTYRSAAGVVAGKDFNVMFTLDRPAREVWRYMKDFNLWQNSYGYHYTGVVGDLEGSTFHINVRRPGKPEVRTPDYKVLKVIPERLIVVEQPVPADGSNGGISPGYHVVTLNEHDGKTVVTFLMQHASAYPDKTEEEALARPRKQAPESQQFWKDIFIPNLKKLVYEGRGK